MGPRTGYKGVMQLEAGSAYLRDKVETAHDTAGRSAEVLVVWALPLFYSDQSDLYDLTKLL